MRYNRCLRCELNYVLNNNEFCELCKKEIAGDYYQPDENIIDENICPYCEKNVLTLGEEMCDSCMIKKTPKNKNLSN